MHIDSQSFNTRDLFEENQRLTLGQEVKKVLDSKEIEDQHCYDVLKHKDELIFQQNDKVEGFYFINYGHVKIIYSQAKGRDLQIRESKAGDIIGHRGIGGDWMYPVSAIATTKTLLTFISKVVFDKIVASEISVSNQMLLFYAEDLRSSEEKLLNIMHEESTLLDSLMDGVCIIEDGEITKVNKGFIKMTGYSEKDTIGRNFDELLVIDKRHSNYDLIMTKNCTTKYVFISKSESINNKRIVIVKDNSSYHIAKQKLIQNEAILKKMSVVVEQNMASIIITDIKGNIEYVNKSFEEISGFSSDEVIGKNPRILSYGGKSQYDYKLMWDTLHSGKVWYGEFRNKTKKGELLIEKVNISSVKDESNKITHFVAIKDDITKMRKNDEKNEELISSINYAKKIQEAILPKERIYSKYFLDSYVYYKPKDIVAGDFYWIEKNTIIDSNGTKREFIYFASADCTGNGVPGALTSVVCSNALGRALREFNVYKPSDILDITRDLIIDNFKDEENVISDGMDISLCCYELGTRNLYWAGANNPLYVLSKLPFTNDSKNHFDEVIQSDNFQLGIMKGDIEPVGNHPSKRPFKNHLLILNDGDVVITSTDGYQDQFGGVRGKKYMSRNFKKLLHSLSTSAISDHVSILDSELLKWQGNQEQVDDICILGKEFNFKSV